MKIIATPIEGVMELLPDSYKDPRGYFFESFNQKQFENRIERSCQFVQDNISYSKKGVLRGMHYQTINPQGKLVRVVSGEVYDAVIDLRASSATYGKWYGTILSESNKKQLWIPPGLAHGFLVLSEEAFFLYKTTDYYNPSGERCIQWNDAEIGIDWPLVDDNPLISEKDALGLSFCNAEKFS